MFNIIKISEQCSENIKHFVSQNYSHIRKPYALEEIFEKVKNHEYNPELMLQHLLLWVSANNLNTPVK